MKSPVSFFIHSDHPSLLLMLFCDHSDPIRSFLPFQRNLLQESDVFFTSTTTKIPSSIGTLSFLTKSTLLIPSGTQILLSYYSSNSFDNEWSCWMLLSGRCDRGLQLLLDHTESGCKRTEEDRKLIIFAFIRSCRSTPSHGWSSVIPFSFLWCIESNTKEMITHNEVVFGNETDRLSGGNISWNFTEST